MIDVWACASGPGRGRPSRQAIRALAEIRGLLRRAAPARSLIEFLHRIQDAHGAISAAHIVALAAEMRLAMTEVYEVATFYHHFDVVKEDEAPPPPLTVRVCETLSCRMAGSEALHAALERSCGAGVRVIGAPCIGRCEQAPAAVVDRPSTVRRPNCVARHCRTAGRVADSGVPTTLPIRVRCYRAAIQCVQGDRSPGVLRRWKTGLRGWAERAFRSAAGASCAPSRRRD